MQVKSVVASSVGTNATSTANSSNSNESSQTSKLSQPAVVTAEIEINDLISRLVAKFKYRCIDKTCVCLMLTLLFTVSP